MANYTVAAINNVTATPGEISCDDHWDIAMNNVDSMLYGPSEVVFITVVLPVIVLAGIVSNLAFMFVVIRSVRMRTQINVYLFNLAIADVVLLAIALGLLVTSYVTSPVKSDASYIDATVCLVAVFTSDVTYYVSLCLITCVTVNKYCAICRPLQTMKSSLKKQTIMLTVCSWVAAILLSASATPYSYFGDTTCLTWPKGEEFSHLPSEITLCYPDVYYAFFGVQAIPFFVALIVNVALFVRIVRVLRTSIRGLRYHGSGRDRSNHRVTRMLMVNGVLFFLLLAPFETLTFSWTNRGKSEVDMSRDSGRMEEVSRVFMALVYVNSVINPIVYTMMSRRYRQAFRETLWFRRVAIRKNDSFRSQT
ncbi:neuropeptides capa receptor-like [Diadema setosum]|uniref:neuropeptides capa receptor-like n=1 Tax=Diadema setosum TaxID=31175 RepID=UPI003B3B2DCF